MKREINKVPALIIVLVCDIFSTYSLRPSKEYSHQNQYFYLCFLAVLDSLLMNFEWDKTDLYEMFFILRDPGHTTMENIKICFSLPSQNAYIT